MGGRPDRHELPDRHARLLPAVPRAAGRGHGPVRRRAGAADLSLTQEELARLEEVSRPPLLYPYRHQAKTAADRLGPADLSLLGPHLAG